MKAGIKTVLILTLAIVASSLSKAQVYQTSGSTFNYGAGIFSGHNELLNLSVPNCTLSDAVTINQSAGTIDQAGSVYLGAGTATGTFQETQQLGAVFPNPPTTVSGSVSLTLSFAGAVIPFDSGPESLNYEGGTLWGFGGEMFDSLPFTIDYSLTTGGQTYEGSSSVNLLVYLNFGSTVNVADYPASVQFSPQLPAGLVQESADSGINFTAQDGFVLSGLTVTPEPSTLALLGFGGILFIRFFKRNR